MMEFKMGESRSECNLLIEGEKVEQAKEFVYLGSLFTNEGKHERSRRGMGNKACGVLEVICGFILLCDTRRVLLSRLLAAPDSSLTHAPFYYVALALLVAGLGACAVAALGCWATYLPGYIILSFYFIVVLCLTGGEVACGALAAAWPRCAGLASARGGAVGALQAYYALPDYEHFTAAVDLAQTELECCGMTNARNYDMSIWQLRRLGPRGLAVPLSCCTQEPERESYLNPRPVNESRCQEIQPSEVFRHIPVYYQNTFLHKPDRSIPLHHLMIFTLLWTAYPIVIVKLVPSSSLALSRFLMSIEESRSGNWNWDRESKRERDQDQKQVQSREKNA
ncbi:hypothetical protein EVAR_79961_1 [Eumeta japonica]|uniref:Tetraspanin n=1 Tax=Eumeta variegata TaxID=151549 RepID=A0A4C1Y1G1_EUMVA|nr:hypothetical protein EVAR_79961_1 [Eumeta japonica]